MTTCVICDTPLTGRQTVTCAASACRYRRMYEQQKASGYLQRRRSRPEGREKQRERNALRAEPRACAGCGEIFMPAAVHRDQPCCGRICAARLGSGSGGRCVVPVAHPARWFGAQCAVEYRDCAWCGHLLCRNDRLAARTYCSDSCAWRAKAERRRSRETAYPNDSWTWAEFMALVARLGWCCTYCGQRFATSPEPDHVIALSRGGRNRLANIVPSCSACNSDKRHLSLADWAAERERLGKPPRNTHLRLQHLLDLAA